MTADGVPWDDVVPAYRRQWLLARGDRADRLRSTEDFWAWEAVNTAALDGTLPLAVLDALVGDPEGDSDYRAYVGAGPVEDLLNRHADAWGPSLAERGRTDQRWAEALGAALPAPAPGRRARRRRGR